MTDPGTILVHINGGEEELPAGTTVTGLVDQLKLPTRGVALEVSGKIIPRGNWDSRTLDTGDRVEIVEMVGGG